MHRYPACKPSNYLGAYLRLAIGLWPIVSAADDRAETEIFTLDQLIVTGETQQISQAYTPMKSGSALIDTPASLSIATKELLEAQGATSLQDSIRNISGLMHEGNNYGIGDQLSLRPGRFIYV